MTQINGKDHRRYLRSFSGENLTQIAMPMGGIGAGNVCLTGFGSLVDYSIRNKPATSALADKHGTSDTAFAVIHVKGAKSVTRLIEGPFPATRIYDQGLKGQGFRESGHEGLPRFERCTFLGAYPFGRVELADSHVPLEVGIRGWNPFVPLDDINSGIPCAILEYSFHNPGTAAVEFEFSYHLSHLAPGKPGKSGLGIVPKDISRAGVMPGFGVSYSNTEPATSELFGSAALGVIGHVPKIKGNWFRGSWFDGISAIWRELSTGTFRENEGNPDKDLPGRNGASVMLPVKLQPGESITIPVVISWYFPNVGYSVGTDPSAPAASLLIAGDCGPGCECAPKWRPFYVSQWKDAAAVAAYVRENYVSLKSRTEAFCDAMMSSTLPVEVLDAVSANLAIIKSPTILRQENGNLWGWEGCFADAGCCPGSCTHVWNYAQAIPHLFPALERTLREQELLRSMDERGHTGFRAALPDGPVAHGFHAAADGQLGGIMKLYRDWQISGDLHWLEKLYPAAKRSLDYCIAAWDPDHMGALFEPHHNTFDIEFWGPDGMCTSIYVGALAAAAAMARELGRGEDVMIYEPLAQKGARLMDESLFNGEYFFQRVQWRELYDQHYVKMLATRDQNDPEIQLLLAEGPKYQYGTGCLSDGVIGAWFAKIYGVSTPVNVANIRKHLKAVFDHNFKRDLFEHASTQRPGYAMGHEAALLICTWPRGGKPTLPFVYSDEAWTGNEYQVASHLIEEGMVEEGLEIVRAVRSRYEGKVRNPFNEYECGNYYARAMASFAVLNSMSGFSYSAVTKQLRLAPKVKERPFTTFFSTASGFGTITIDAISIGVKVIEGELAVESLAIDGRRAIHWSVLIKAGQTEAKLIQ